MGIYSNVTEQDLMNLRKLADQEKNQRALKIENRILKQTHDIKLAKSVSPITMKLEEVDKSTKNLGEIRKESNSENENIQEIVPSEIDFIETNLKPLPNSSNFSISMRQMLGSLMKSRNSLKITQDDFGQAKFLGIPIQISLGNIIKIKDIIYDLTPEIYIALSSTSYNGKTMKNESDILMMNNIINDLG